MFIVLLEFVVFVFAAVLSLYTYYHILYVYCIVSLCHQWCLTFYFSTSPELPSYTWDWQRYNHWRYQHQQSCLWHISRYESIQWLNHLPSNSHKPDLFSCSDYFSNGIHNNLQLPLLLQLPQSLQLPLVTGRGKNTRYTRVVFEPLMLWYMDVSEHSGTPKSSILIGFSIINHPF